jgi:UDP-N-acetylmuramyl pentapeptide phosphotransferase/UDP-N-acetylglucosamine-1-phosphate transferase
MDILELYFMFLTIVSAAMASAFITWAIRPLLLRYAPAKPNARSSHYVPTPQGAGIAVITATLGVAGTVIHWVAAPEMHIAAQVFCAAAFLAVVGLADDIKSIPIWPRLVLQAIAVGAVVAIGFANLRIVPACPLWIERGLLFLALLWFVNLVNFMDGLDWMTVAEVVPITGAIVVLNVLNLLDYALEMPAIIAAALCGAMLGFAPFNRPVAKIFLGDVGSLPIGLLLGWCLLELAYGRQFVAALLLPLYYLSDATVTLLRRVARREPFWAAHRTHFYQRATDNGFTVRRVVSEVFALNIVLAALALGSILSPSIMIRSLMLAAGAGATAFLMYRFSQPRRRA